MTATTTLGELLARLKQGTPVPLPDDEDWPDLLARTAVPGRVCEVSGAAYDHFLDVLPPRWMDRGGFAVGEGADPLRLFWAANTPSGRRFYCRQLDESESDEFGRLAGVARPAG